MLSFCYLIMVRAIVIPIMTNWCLYMIIIDESIFTVGMYCIVLSSSFPIHTGDPRRPYPQDIEMRSGVLGKLSSDVSSIKEPESSGENLTLELNGKVNHLT